MFETIPTSNIIFFIVFLLLYGTSIHRATKSKDKRLVIELIISFIISLFLPFLIGVIIPVGYLIKSGMKQKNKQIPSA